MLNTNILVPNLISTNRFYQNYETDIKYHVVIIDKKLNWIEHLYYKKTKYPKALVSYIKQENI